MDRASNGPLDRVRVLELGNYIAAPTAGRLLADFGAEVIKIERPITCSVHRFPLFVSTTSCIETHNMATKSSAL